MFFEYLLCVSFLAWQWKIQNVRGWKGVPSRSTEPEWNVEQNIDTYVEPTVHCKATSELPQLVICAKGRVEFILRGNKWIQLHRGNLLQMRLWGMFSRQGG